METFWTWFTTGNPAPCWVALGLAYSAAEAWLGATKKTEANSLLGLLARGAKALLGRKGVPVALVLAFAFTGCSPTVITNARRSLAAADRVMTQGISLFQQHDLMTQKEIVRRAPNPTIAREDIAKYRDARVKVVDAFKLLGEAAHATKAGLDAVEAQKSDADALSPLLVGLVHAAKGLQDAAGLVGLTIPGLSEVIGR